MMCMYMFKYAIFHLTMSSHHQMEHTEEQCNDGYTSDDYTLVYIHRIKRHAHSRQFRGELSVHVSLRRGG